MLGSRCREDACQQSLLVVNQENRAARLAVHPDEAPSPERYWRHRHQPDQPSLREVQAERGVFRMLPFKVGHYSLYRVWLERRPVGGGAEGTRLSNGDCAVNLT